MKTGASFSRGTSRQDYRTPPEFIKAVELRFGPLEYDLAATDENRNAPNWFGPGAEIEDSLTAPWPKYSTCWLNPPFGDIEPWARKCAHTLACYAREKPILLLTPASIGSAWFAECVYPFATVIALRGRLCFDGIAPYPKDCILSVYLNATPGRLEVWDWRRRQ